MSSKKPRQEDRPAPAPAGQEKDNAPAAKPKETGGPAGPEPTRYGDWERGGKCVDF